ncbi:hypothetical protein AGOR_G00102210 [Albula goreensis]|uniref:Saposin B-type domain-containing protein n=1 Tax=Albula goreensis TaxID=1534307 RepID=A0A8T3DCU3_9TELE|nr:hypothetical protein AGOR_G00102210 [Albula goreensis]
MLRYFVIGSCLVVLAFGKHVPDADLGEDFPLEFSDEGDLPDLDVPLDLSALVDPALFSELEKELQLRPGTLNDTQKIPGICWACKKVMGWVVKKILPKDTKRHISHVLHTVCRSIYIPSFLCKYLVNGYFAKLVHQLLTGHSAKWICRALRLCWWPQHQKLFSGKPQDPRILSRAAANRPPTFHLPH